MSKISKLIISILISNLAGIIGLFFTNPAVDGWYSNLTKSALNPPAWVFGPTWTILFILMGVAAYFVWDKGLKNKKVKICLLIFIIQLVLNAIWSIIFFGLHSPFWALIEIIILWITIMCTIIAFYKVSKLAAWLLLPYILWVSFATYLNYSVFALN